jgi:hypothetical protein
VAIGSFGTEGVVVFLHDHLSVMRGVADLSDAMRRHSPCRPALPAPAPTSTVPGKVSGILDLVQSGAMPWARVQRHVVTPQTACGEATKSGARGVRGGRQRDRRLTNPESPGAEWLIGKRDWSASLADRRYDQERATEPV